MTCMISFCWTAASQVECLEMKSIGNERAGLPEAASLLPGPLVQRQVKLAAQGVAASCCGCG